MHGSSPKTKSASPIQPPSPAKRFFSIKFPNQLPNIIIIILITVISGFVFASVQIEMKKNLSAQLQAILSANVESLRIWVKDKKMDAEVLAGHPEIREKIISLIQLAKEKDLNAEVLNQSKELKWLRRHLGEACRKYDFVGFVVLDQTGFQVGALLEEPVGQRKLIERSDFFYRSLQGDSVVSHPFPGETDLPDSQGNWRPDRPTMFASTPIYNQKGQIIGVLAFRFRPEVEFSHILDMSRFGKTGESFAFNDDGFLLTHSRFFDQLKKRKLIPGDSRETSILNVQLRDPRKSSSANSRNLRPGVPPLTLMAENAIKGEPGVNVDGYAGYRGKRVVGAWTWIPDLHMGVATEIEAKEALGSITLIFKGFILIFGLLIAVTVAAFILRLVQKRMEKERNLAQDHVQEREIRIQAILDNNIDGIIAFDDRGIIETFNPAAERLFGYRPSEVLNRNVSILWPEPYGRDHDQHIKKYLSTDKAESPTTPREIRGLRKDRSIFDLELSLSAVASGEKTWFFGTLRDVTERKKAEDKLRAHAKQQSALTKLGLIALPGDDLQELMDQAVHLISRTLKVEDCQVLKYIPDEKAFLIQAAWGWDKELVGKAKVPDGMESQAGYTLRTNRPVVVKDLNEETRFSSPRLFLDKGAISGMSVVIYATTHVFGVLEIYTRKTRVFKMDEINFLQSMANILGNVIERNIAEEKLKHYTDELERSNQALEDFAFIASHDLQEPIRKAMLFGDRIKSAYPSPENNEGKNYIDRLQKSMNKIQGFIHDLLEYSKVTRATPLQLINLQDAVSEAVSNLEAQIKRSRGKIEILPLPFIKGDRFQIVQLFQNLISNALKYARKNETPKIKIRSRQNGNVMWDLLVEDNGIGIDPKYFHKIFKPFERLHSGDQYSGAGIGLAICAKVLIRHKGSIQVESQPDKGSTFIITLPGIQPAASGSRITKETEPGIKL